MREDGFQVQALRTGPRPSLVGRPPCHAVSPKLGQCIEVSTQGKDDGNLPGRPEDEDRSSLRGLGAPVSDA